MLINNEKYVTESHVKFVSYTGDYPNLCRGVLTLIIDGETVKFGSPSFEFDYDTRKYDDGAYEEFWGSGGSCDSGGPACGEWIIDVEVIPEAFRKYAAEIDLVFNENVEFGCCGGCY